MNASTSRLKNIYVWDGYAIFTYTVKVDIGGNRMILCLLLALSLQIKKEKIVPLVLMRDS